MLNEEARVWDVIPNVKDCVTESTEDAEPVSTFEASEIGGEEIPRLDFELPDGSTTVRIDTAVKTVVVTTTGADMATEIALKLGVLRVYIITTSEVIIEKVVSDLLEDSGLKLGTEGRTDDDTKFELLIEGRLMMEEGKTTAIDAVVEVVSPFAGRVVVIVLY